MIELEKVYDAYSPEDLVILSINVDPRDTLSIIQDFIPEYEQQYQVEINWIMGKDEDGSIWEKYQLEDGGIPTLYIFDQEGKIHFSHEGLVIYKDIPSWWTISDEPVRLSKYIDELL